MTRTIDEIIKSIEKGLRLQKLDANGDFYEDTEDYNFDKEVDENEEHRLCSNEY